MFVVELRAGRENADGSLANCDTDKGASVQAFKANSYKA